MTGDKPIIQQRREEKLREKIERKMEQEKKIFSKRYEGCFSFLNKDKLKQKIKRYFDLKGYII